VYFTTISLQAEICAIQLIAAQDLSLVYEPKYIYHAGGQQECRIQTKHFESKFILTGYVATAFTVHLL
jgi:hypothetical protein